MSRIRPEGLVGLALLLLCLLPFATSGVINNDELTYLSHGRQLLAGELPYRDFFEFLPPVTLSLTALVVKLGGPSIQFADLMDATHDQVLDFCLDSFDLHEHAVGMLVLLHVPVQAFPELCISRLLIGTLRDLRILATNLDPVP